MDISVKQNSCTLRASEVTNISWRQKLFTDYVCLLLNDKCLGNYENAEEKKTMLNTFMSKTNYLAAIGRKVLLMNRGKSDQHLCILYHSKISKVYH